MRFQLTLPLIFLLSLLGCSSSSFIEKGWEGAPNVESVLILPANFDLAPPTSLQLAAELATDEVEARFLRTGRKVQRASLGEIFSAWDAAGENEAAATEKELSAIRERVRPIVARSLAEKHGADLVVMPTIVRRDAKVLGSYLLWDGVRRAYRSGTLAPGYQGVELAGEQMVISLRVVAYDAFGHRVFERYGGLESMVWLELSGAHYSYGERQDLFSDPAVMQEGVDIALGSLVGKNVDAELGEMAVTKAELAWHRHESGPIAMITNAPPAQAERLFEKILHFTTAATLLLKQQASRPAPVEIVVFATDDAFSAFAREGVGGFAYQGARGTVASLSAERLQLSLPVLYHELVHVLLFQDQNVAYPAWYHEGLAELMSSALVRDEITSVGGVPTLRQYTLQEQDPLPLSDIISRRSYSDLESDLAPRYYTDAWAFVHFLSFGSVTDGRDLGAGLHAYILACNGGVDWESAILPSFGVSLDTLNAEYIAYRTTLAEEGSGPRNLTLPEAEHTSRVVAVSEAAAQSRLGDLARDLGRRKLDLATSHYEQALVLEPNRVDAKRGMALTWAARKDFDQADAILAALPLDGADAAATYEALGRVELLRFEALDIGDRMLFWREYVEEARQAFEHATRLGPERASAWLGLGRTYAIDGGSSAETGIAAFMRADELVPGSLDVKLGLGILHARAGRIALARRNLQRALVSHDPAQAREARRLLDQLDSEMAANP
jgi:tetratricopeptide (TPR) repeat protein